MELRPDITVAAAKLTSGFDVSRELRQLGAHLRDGEIVHRLAAGVYGSGGGLLAVTNRRVLLLRDGRGGQASEGFPLELLTTVDWIAGPARGAIVVGDADHTAELTQVEPVEGASVVKLIRSLLPRDTHEGVHGDDGYDSEYDEYDELAEAGEDALLTHGAPAMSGARRSTGDRESVGSRQSGGGRQSGGEAARSGRFAVTMKLRQPRDTPRGTPPRKSADVLVPEQKSASERSMPTRAVRPVEFEDERSDRGYDTDRSGRRYEDKRPGRGYEDERRAGGFEDERDDRGYENERPVRDYEDDRPGRRSVERRSTTSGGFAPAGAVPVSALSGRTSGDLDRSASFPEQSFEQEPGSGPAPAPEYAPEHTGGSRRGRTDSPSGGHAVVTGVRGIEGSGALAGEVPVHKLAEETGGQNAVSRIDERSDRYQDERPARFEDRRSGRFEDDLDERFQDDHDEASSRFDERRPRRSDDERRPDRSRDGRSGRSEDRRGARFDGPIEDDSDDLDDLDSAGGRFDERRPSRSEDRRGERPGERRRPMYGEDSGEFRRTRPAIDSRPGSATGSLRDRGEVRSRGLLHDDDFDERSRRSKWLWIGGVAAAVAALGAVGGVALLHHSDSPAAVNPAPAASDSLAGPVVKVTKVIDGDTIEVSGPVTGQVEVIGISAPRSDKGQCGATASTAFASRTLAGTSVTLVTDPSQPATDKSGRRLASLRTDNGFDYAVLAAGAGMVRAYEGGTPVAQAQEIKNAQNEAEKAERGLWGSPCNGKLTLSSSSSSSAKSASSGSDSSVSTEGSSAGSTRSSAEPASTSSSSTR